MVHMSAHGPHPCPWCLHHFCGHNIFEFLLVLHIFQHVGKLSSTHFNSIQQFVLCLLFFTGRRPADVGAKTKGKNTGNWYHYKGKDYDKGKHYNAKNTVKYNWHYYNTTPKHYYNWHYDITEMRFNKGKDYDKGKHK